MLRVGGTVCLVDEVLEESEQVVLRHYETGEKRVATFDELGALRGGIDFSVLAQPATENMVELLSRNDEERKELQRLPTQGISKARFQGTLEKIRWLDVLRKAGYRDFKAADLRPLEIKFWAAKHGLPERTPETLAKWAGMGADSGARLIPHYDARGGPGQRRCDAAALDILGCVIADARKGKLELLIDAVDSEMRHRIDESNKQSDRQVFICAPSISTVSRCFHEEVTPYEYDVARFGKIRADRKHKPTERRLKIDFPGGVSEFDDFDTGVFCVFERTGLPWGRPFITGGIDQDSAFPVGRSTGTQARSATSAVDALVNSIEQKLELVDMDGNPLQWESYGFPVQAVFDNALYNNERIVSLNADVSDPGWARAFEPTDKRQIEYHVAQTKAWLRTLPGWRGAKDDPEALKQGLATAVMPFEQLDLGHLYWLLQVYANRPMKDGLTPRQKYVDSRSGMFRPRMPPDVRRLRLLRLWRFPGTLKWTQGGIRTMGLTFQSAALYRRWIGMNGGSLMVTGGIDPFAMGALFIDIPGRDVLLEIPCLDSDYIDGLTLYQHQLILKLCREEKNKHPSLPQMHRARHKLREMTEQWRRSGKVRERKKAARAGDIPPARSTEPDSEAVHDLQAGCEALASVKMEQGDEGWEFPSE